MDNWQIDKNSPLPYYYQLEHFIQQDIDRGILKKGVELCSEGEMAKKLDISIGVVRQALKRLENDGIVNRQKGKRARIAVDPKIKLTHMAQLSSLEQELKQKHLDVRTKVLKQVLMPANSDICELLEIEKNQDVVQLTRLRSVNGKPMIFWISHLSSKLCPGLEKEDLKNASLYMVLENRYNLKPTFTQDTLEVVHADNYLSKLLQVSIGDPLVYLISVSRLKNNTVMEHYEAWHVSDGWKFVFQSKL